MEEDKCVFCMIVAKKIPSKIVYEDQALLGIMDINPASKGHIIMIPKKHYNNIYEIPQDEFLQYMNVTRAVGYAILLSLAPNNVELLYTKELTKGSITPHALIHLIPRYNEDTINHVWQPLKMEESDFTAIANAIKSAIEQVKNAEVPKPTNNVKTVAETSTEKPKEEEKKTPPNLIKKVVVF